MANFGLLLAAIFFTGAGAAITVNMKLVPNPGDGIVAAVAERLGRDQGFAKNVFDVGCVAVTCVLGLLAAVAAGAVFTVLRNLPGFEALRPQ